VRGLSPKFNRVTVEGVPMASTSNSDRSIDLSLIGDDLIKDVELSKSLRADLDADAIGGSVNLTLRQAPENFHFDVTGNGGFNQLGKNWNNYKYTASLSNRFFDNALGARLQVSVEQKQIPQEQFGGSYSAPQLYPGTTDQFYIQTQSAVLTATQQKRNRSGASAIFDYTSDFVDLSFYNLFSEKDDNVITSANTINFLDAGIDGGFSRQYTLTSYHTSERSHSLQSLFKLGDTRLDVSLAYTNAGTDAPGQYFPFIEVSTRSVFPTASALYNAQPSALIAAMGASNPGNTYLQRFNIFNTTLLDENYDGKMDYKVPFALSDDLSGTLSVGGKYHGTRRESDGSGQFFNLEYGGGQSRRDFLVGTFPWINTPHGAQRGVIATNFLAPGYDYGTFLDGRYALDWSASVPLMNYLGSTLYNAPAAQGLYFRDGTVDYQNDYASKEDTYAAYGMAEFNLLDKRLTVLPGMRFEREWTQYQAYQITLRGANANGLGGIPKSVISDRKNDLWFPSVNMKYKVTEDIQIMGAAYKSEAKPDFLQTSPLVIYTETPTYFVSQNPFLKPATANNFDLSVSLFNNEIGLFTIGGFYKEISNLIISLANYQPYQNATWQQYPADLPGRLPSLSYYDTTWFSQNPTGAATIPINNPEKAYIRGIEFSWQTHFWYLPGFLTGLVLDLNLSYIGSNTQYPYFQSIQTGVKNDRGHTPIYGLFYQTRGGAVVDQPKSIANAIIGWDYMGFSIRTSFRYQQTTLTSLDSKFSLSDAYYDNFLLIDISAKQQILDNLAVFANFTNLSSHIDDYYINGVTGQLPTSSQSYGLRAQFGVVFNY
jgi:TonB-dependent receptor